MSDFQQKLKYTAKEENIAQENKASIKTRYNMTSMLKISDSKFKVTMINKLRTLVKKVDKMKEEVGNGSTEIEMLTRKLKRNGRNQTTIDMKNTFDGLKSRLKVTEERISELEHRSTETSQTEKQRKRIEKK